MKLFRIRILILAVVAIFYLTSCGPAMAPTAPEVTGKDVFKTISTEKGIGAYDTLSIVLLTTTGQCFFLWQSDRAIFSQEVEPKACAK